MRKKWGGKMRKYTRDKLMDEALKFKSELSELEKKPEKTEADQKRMLEIKDWLYQVENALKGGWK